MARILTRDYDGPWPKPGPKTVKVGKAWKWMEIVGKPLDAYHSRELRFGVWLRAMTTSPQHADHGWHVFHSRKEARASRWGEGRGRTLLRVEVSGLVAHGKGDGLTRSFETHLPAVSTFVWLRVTKPKRAR